MGRKQNVDLAGDPEYEEFTNMLENSGRSYATKKSYRTSYRKLRDPYNVKMTRFVHICI